MQHRTLSALCLTIAVSGCVTAAEGERLRMDVDSLKSETATLQRELADLKAVQVGRLQTMETRVRELEATLLSLRQADADGGVQIEKVVSELQMLRGEIEVAKHELGTTRASVESILARPPVGVAVAASAPKSGDPNKVTQIGGQEVPTDKKAHYDFAKKLYDDKKFTEAAEAFDLYIARNPKDTDFIDNAAFWMAESYTKIATDATDRAGRDKALKQAILAYQRVLDDPGSEKVDGALFKIGLCFEQLGFADEARVFYEELVAKHPKSSLVVDAKKRLKALKPAKKSSDKGKGKP